MQLNIFKLKISGKDAGHREGQQSAETEARGLGQGAGVRTSQQHHEGDADQHSVVQDSKKYCL